MATAKRQTFREWIRDLFYPEWLKPKQGAPSPSGAGHPQYSQPMQPPAPVSGTGTPLSHAPSGHAQVTLIPPSAPKPQSPPTVLGSDLQTGEAVSLTLDERLQG